MAWQDAMDLSKFVVSSAAFGGPIGMFDPLTPESDT